ncbi:hypothetical protein HMPREF1863_00791 [Aedoeadaptatus coxii]|uniref:Uncharacterized protein n=1 Tax=Aedoeadaptatus coxii TaxID=755172 RepID=A0A134AHC8_9FIRM|nr:hypothetical protein HMPREF1863_00791 [Peptoniphilus coxii]
MIKPLQKQGLFSCLKAGEWRRENFYSVTANFRFSARRHHVELCYLTGVIIE